MNRFTKWAEREYSIEQRIPATLLAGVLFVLLVPYFIFWTAREIDNWLNLPRFIAHPFNYLVGGIVIIFGLVLAFWSILSQLTLGRGTPLPMMATQKLLVTGPFKYSRNPMSLGAMLIYLGTAIMIGSFSAIGIVIFLSAILFLYLKRVEERELKVRFGEPYLQYKSEVPFLFPKFRKR